MPTETGVWRKPLCYIKLLNSKEFEQSQQQYTPGIIIMNRLAANSRNGERDKSTISVKSHRGSSRNKLPSSSPKSKINRRTTANSRPSSAKKLQTKPRSKQLNRTAVLLKPHSEGVTGMSFGKKPKNKPKKSSKSEQAARESLRPQYRCTVERVFKRIDFFNRGYLDASCISKWIEPEVLYFFGGLFHKIRSKGLQLPLRDFIRHADKVFETSTLADIRDFIEVTGKDNIATIDSAMQYTADGKVAMTRGVAAVTQAAALAPASTARQRQALRLGELNFEMDIPPSKQTVTPLFSDTSALRRIDINQPADRLQSNAYSRPPSTKTAYHLADLKHSFNQSDTKPEDSKLQPRISLSSQQRSKQNIRLSRQLRDLQQARFGRLQDRMDYFIQRNSEHLHVSQYVRRQHGY